MKHGSPATREANSDGSHQQVIAIDGPAAAGKTTVARVLADRVRAIFLDTGLLYRAVTLAALKCDIAPSDSDALASLTDTLNIEMVPSSETDGSPLRVLLDGRDVTTQLRSQAVDRHVSEVSAHAAVRAALLPSQRRIAERGPVVMVGRDIASAVVPDAGVKIYLDASLGERAHRRQLELIGRGSNVGYDAVLADLARRDRADSSRENAPLKMDADAFVVGTDGLTIDEVVSQLEQIVRGAWRTELAQDAEHP